MEFRYRVRQERCRRPLVEPKIPTAGCVMSPTPSGNTTSPWETLDPDSRESPLKYVGQVSPQAVLFGRCEASRRGEFHAAEGSKSDIVDFRPRRIAAIVGSTPPKRTRRVFSSLSRIFCVEEAGHAPD
ncbi:hypothetical protein KM043_012241 [Ampulex compressa]|nr:hypothetical protein KM043_012241 [Ampulex compressa]